MDEKDRDKDKDRDHPAGQEERTEDDRKRNGDQDQRDNDNGGDEDGGGDEADDEKEKEENQRSGILEKVFTVLSSGILILMVGYLTVQIFQEREPTGFLVTPSVPRAQGEFMAVAVTVQNTGDEPAKQVHLRGEARAPAEAAEGEEKPAEAEATLDWLPGRSSRHVTLLFPEETNLQGLVVEVVGYEEP